jgi:pimeloyl-ACP methyl ester carboxylesterase
MKSEVFYSEGDREKPLIIFIPGIGMNAAMWADPSSARILGGKYPLSVLLGEAEMRTSFQDLKGLGYSVLALSQKRPAGAAMLVVDELQELIAKYSAKLRGSIILIGHSRGGLIARRFLQDNNNAFVRGVITIGAPHRGSTMAKWVAYTSPLSSALKKIMDITDKDVKSVVHRVVAFLNGKGIRDMLPGSDFLVGLSDKRAPGVRIVSIGGTDPALVKIGRTSLPDLLTNFIPESSLPDEIRKGKGDGFVSAASSVYPGGSEHRDFRVHHAGLIFDRDVREYIRKVVTSLTV